MGNYLNINGGNLYYKVLGKGKPLFIIHGGPGSNHSYLMGYFDELINNGYSLIYFDQRGCGKSIVDVNNLNITETIEDIERLRIILGYEKIDIFGHSFGTYLAIRYALTYKDNVNKLILCNSVPLTRADINKGDINKEEKINIQKSKIRPRSKNDYIKLDISTNFNDPNYVDDFINNMNDTSFNHNTNQIIINEFFNSIESLNLNNLVCKTLILGSDKDFIPTSTSEYIYENIPNGNTIIFRNCGHYIFVEKNKEMIEIIIKFLKSNN